MSGGAVLGFLTVALFLYYVFAKGGIGATMKSFSDFVKTLQGR
jgi:hypothetical protein